MKDRSIFSALAHRQVPELGQRGVAGPEVVKRETDAKLADPGEDIQGPFGIAHKGALGDLEL